MLFSRIVPSGLVLAVLILRAAAALAEDHKFRFEKADARSVALVGEFNQWHAQQMKKGPDGSWSLTIPLSSGTYGYKFLVNGSDWVFDPTNSQRKTVDEMQNSAVEIGPASESSDSSFGSAAPSSSVAPAPSVAPRAATFSSTPPAGLVPTPGEELVTEIKLSLANRVLAVHEGNAGLTPARIALVVPQGFDPAKPWPILVINNTENYGNIDAMHEFKDAAIAECWIILAADPIEAEKHAHGRLAFPVLSRRIG